MLRRSLGRVAGKYVRSYGPDRYGPRGWPAEAEHLNVPGVHARMRRILEDVDAGRAVDLRKAARCCREAGAVLDFVAAAKREEAARIDARYGHVFRTAHYVSGEFLSAYRRLRMARDQLAEAQQLGARLRSLAARCERRAAVRHRLARTFTRTAPDDLEAAELDALPRLAIARPGPLRDTAVAAILAGTKTTTAGLLLGFGRPGRPFPDVGQEYAVVDSADRPVAVVEVTQTLLATLGETGLRQVLDQADDPVAHDELWHPAEVREELSDPELVVDDGAAVLAQRFRLVRAVSPGPSARS